jgi:hypothetical protein
MDLPSLLGYFDLAKKLKAAYDKADQVAVRSLVAAIQEAEVDARLAVVAMKEENLSLREQLASCREKSAKQAELKRLANGLYTDDGVSRYCSRCYEVRKITVSVLPKEMWLGGVSDGLTGIMTHDNGTNYWLECPECETHYGERLNQPY